MNVAIGRQPYVRWKRSRVVMLALCVVLVSRAGCARALYRESPLKAAKVAPPLSGHYFIGYGSDDRVPPEQSEWIAEAATVFAVIPERYLEHRDNGYAIVRQVTLGDVVSSWGSRALCERPRFGYANEYVFPDASNSCSAIAVGARLMLTARHCVGEIENPFVEDRPVFVFGAKVNGRPFQQLEIYRAKRLVRRGEEDVNDDWAVVELEQAVPEHRVYTGGLAVLENDGRTVAATALGHPSRLGLLVSPGQVTSYPRTTEGQCRDLPRMLLGDLDVSGGSSGGPIFDNETRLLIGLVKGGAGHNRPLPHEHVPGNCVKPLLLRPDFATCRGMLGVSAARFKYQVEQARRAMP